MIRRIKGRIFSAQMVDSSMFEAHLRGLQTELICENSFIGIKGESPEEKHSASRMLQALLLGKIACTV